MTQIWPNFGVVVDVVGRGAGKLNLSLKEPPLPIVRSLGGTSTDPHFTIFQNIKVTDNHRQVFLSAVKRQTQ